MFSLVGLLSCFLSFSLNFYTYFALQQLFRLVCMYCTATLFCNLIHTGMSCNELVDAFGLDWLPQLAGISVRQSCPDGLLGVADTSVCVCVCVCVCVRVCV